MAELSAGLVRSGAPARNAKWLPVVMAAAAALLLALPFMLNDYVIFQLTLVLATAVALVGLNLLTGFNGQISLGHGAFAALGAYTTAILMDDWSVSYAVAVPCAAVVCLVFGMLFGLPALRLAELYLALATFALGMSLPQLLKYKRLEEWTGGVQGITLQKPSAPFGLPLNADQWLYFLALFVLVLCLWGAYNILHSHAGRAIIAIRDQPIAAAAMGIDLARYKTICFGISAMYTGLGGALTALSVQFIAPDSFTSLSIELLVGIVVGGLASLSGAVYGAFFIRLVPAVADELSKSAMGAIYGLILIGFVYLMPGGIAGFVNLMLSRVRAAINRRGHE
jgi:branched-chain amino acid transport system permease protein